MAKKTKTEMKRDDERRALKQYLTRYFKAREKQAILQDRLSQLRHELRRHGDVDTSEIERRINEQAKREKKIVLEIMDVLDLLPPDSTERLVMELRHIDCKPWADIQEAVHFSKSQCFEYYNRGLDQLLQHKEVHSALRKYRAFSQGKNADFESVGG